MILLTTAYKRLLAIALAACLVCALFYGCNKPPELPPESETESETTEDPWTFETETETEPTTEEPTEPPTTTRKPTTTTRTTTRTTTTTEPTTTTNPSTTIPDGSDKPPTSTTTTTTSTTPTTYIKATNVKFNGASAYTMAAGNTQNLSWTVSPANATNKGVVFFTSNSAVAEVSPGGVVTAKGGGTCTITIKTTDPQAATNYEDTVTITVSAILVTSISISGGATVGVGGSLQLTATVGPANATNKTVTWSVDPSDAATINSSGVLTALKTGPVDVTAKANDASGVSDTRRIQITS